MADSSVHRSSPFVDISLLPLLHSNIMSYSHNSPVEITPQEPSVPGDAYSLTTSAVSQGPRATALTTAICSALAQTLKTISYPHFASCFPTIATNRASNLAAVHNQMIERLEALARNEFASILDERDVVRSLNELDNLIQDARRRRVAAGDDGATEAPVPPHTLSAEVQLQAHLAPWLEKQRGSLNARLQTLQGKNAELWTQVERQREEIRALVEVMEAVVRDLDSAGEVVARDAASVRAEVREMEMEV